MQKLLIEKIADRLNGNVRPIPNGLSIELIQDRLPFVIEIEQPNQNLITVSAWLRSFPVPEQERDWIHVAFYLGTVNSNLSTDKMRWNDRGEFGFQSTIIFDDNEPEFVLRTAVDRISKQIVAFGPGLNKVRNGESPEAVVVKDLDHFLGEARQEPVPVGSNEYRSIARLFENLDHPRERIPGGIAVIISGIRIELSADKGGRFLVRAIGPRVHIESHAWNAVNFYPPLVNSNESFGTLHLYELGQLASRFDLYFPTGRLPSDKLLSVCTRGTVRDVSGHMAGMESVAKGTDVMSALRLAQANMS